MLGIVSTMRGCNWAGSEELWHATAVRAIERKMSVNLFVHRDIATAEPVRELIRLGASVANWSVLPAARLQSWKEKIAPTFPSARLDACDALLVSLGSFPAVCYTPGLLHGLMNTKRPFVLLCQFNSDHLAMSAAERGALRELIGRAAACVFVSEHNLGVTRRQFAIEPPRATVILNESRDMRDCPLPWPKENGDSLNGTENWQFACVARFDVLWKGQDLLLDVLRADRWRNRPWRLRFYGTGTDFDHVRDLTHFFGLQDRVTFEGHVRDLAAIWSRNHLLVMPSRGEGTPLAALEAMMYGRPVVTTDVGGNCEVLADGLTGFIAEAALPRSFDAALERAWQARDRWPAMGQAAHQRAKTLAAADAPGQLLNVIEACA
jgi:L-malate glycosyltransferase